MFNAHFTCYLHLQINVCPKLLKSCPTEHCSSGCRFSLLFTLATNPGKHFCISWIWCVHVQKNPGRFFKPCRGFLVSSEGFCSLSLPVFIGRLLTYPYPVYQSHRHCRAHCWRRLSHQCYRTGIIRLSAMALMPV